MKTSSPGQWDHCSGTCYPARYRSSGGGIVINRQKAWHFSHIGNVPAGKVDFYAAMLHEMGHYIGVGHDILLRADGTIERNNLMGYAPRISGAIPGGERVQLSNYNNRAVNAATNIVDTSRIHVWTNDFKDKYGVETLAAAGNNSVVQPTPR